MFVNYWRHATRSNPVPLLVARVVTVAYAVWKLASYEWLVLLDWPVFVFETGGEAFLVPAPLALQFLPLELGLLLVLLVGVLVGYRLRATAFLSGVLVAHVSGVHHLVTNQSITYLPLVYLLLLLALFSEDDVVTIDEYRRLGARSLNDLNRFLKGERPGTYPHSLLKWLLLVIALTYFFNGYGKLVTSGPEWMTSANLGRFVQMEILMHLGYPPMGGTFLVTYDVLALLAGVGTIVLEAGFVVSVLTGILYVPFVLGLIGLHTGILIWMHVFFFDQYLLFALYLPWDRAAERFADGQRLVVLYDDRCHFCARVLAVLKHLDTTGTVTFAGPTDLPDAYRNRNGVRPDDAMYVFSGTDQFEGYWAFRRLLSHFAFTSPLVWLMGLRPVVRLGDRVYRVVAANRNRYFTCSIEPGR